jgi:DNA helicase-2/ATP-dependent DNA helicase PcrA
MTDEIVERLAKSENSYLIAPAGYGKTEILTKAVAMSDNGRQLVLTHTHAGVRSIRQRLQKYGVPDKNFYLNTIAGWALWIASSYKIISELKEINPFDNNTWKLVYPAALEVLRNKQIRKVISISYSGVYIDEYQDCTLDQHRFIIELSTILPCRILGDPLQGIFDFDDETVNWTEHVSPIFDRLPDLTIPWRWNKTNPRLGQWLDHTRQNLINGEMIDFSNYYGGGIDRQNQLKICRGYLSSAGSTVAIRKLPNMAHTIAQQLGGRFCSMEEMEANTLRNWFQKYDQTDEVFDKAILLIEITSKCWTKVSTSLNSIKGKLERKDKNVGRLRNNVNVFEKLINFINYQSSKSAIEALEACASVDNAYLYRKELWAALLRTFEVFETDEFESLSDALWYIRNRTSKFGRVVDYRTVSRTLLVKGLEFQHVIVLDATELEDAKNFYVAITRGSHSLMILSPKRTIQFPPFEDMI